MRKNYKVTGTVGFFVDGVLHTCLEYETSWQREQIITDFLSKVKNITRNIVLWYVISVDEESITLPKTKKEHNDSRPRKKEPKLFIRPKAEYSNRQWDEY